MLFLALKDLFADRQIACGDEHTVILFEDGTLWGCGFNFMGQLGLAHGADAFMLTPLTESQGGFWAKWVPLLSFIIAPVLLMFM
jgi:hypothetical protein